MNIQSFVFFDENSTSATSNSLGLTPDVSSMTLQVELLDESASVALKVQALADLNRSNYYDLKVINMGTLQAVSTITTPGIYMIVLSGLNKVRLVSENGVGKFKAYGITTN